MKKKIIYLIAILFILSSVSGAIFEQGYATDTLANTPAGAKFRVNLLRYEPYPVNPGDSFDIWINVENIGSESAQDAQLELIPEYPFSSTDNLLKEYGSISGIIGKEDGKNQVVVKYRLKTADNAAEGTSELKFRVSPSKTEAGFTKKLEIDVGKTKTDFDIVMQDSTAQGTSLAIANIGENPATAVTVRINEQEGFKVKGPEASIIGNLDKGDFTTVTFQLMPDRDANELNVQIGYTDIAGVRNIIEKKVPVDIAAAGLFQEALGGQGFQREHTTGFSSLLFPNGIYIILGVAIAIIAMAIKNKVKKRKQII